MVNGLWFRSVCALLSYLIKYLQRLIGPSGCRPGGQTLQQGLCMVSMQRWARANTHERQNSKWRQTWNGSQAGMIRQRRNWESVSCVPRWWWGGFSLPLCLPNFQHGRDLAVQSLRPLPVVSSSDPGPLSSIVCWLGDKLTSITTTSRGEKVSEFMWRQNPTNICLTGARRCLSAIRRYLAAVEIVPITHPTASSDTCWYCQEEVNWFPIIKRLSLFCAVSCSSVRFCWNGRWSCPNVAYLLIVSTIVGDSSCQHCLRLDLYFFTLAPACWLRGWFSSSSTSWSVMIFFFFNYAFSHVAE